MLNTTARQNTTPRTVLVVEDEPTLATAIAQRITAEGWTARVAGDGASAVQAASQLRPDLVIMDIMLPVMDGLEATKRIVADRPVPVLILTARDAEADKVIGLGAGADDYMTKPFSPSELVARVKAHMDRYNRLIGSTTQKNDIIEIRGIKIDKTARRVWVNGEEKTFTTKEFDLLTFLAQNPNRVFTKEELFRKIWDMESVGDIATVTVHIKKIREKIEYNNAKPQYIETIWGVGYRFKV